MIEIIPKLKRIVPKSGSFDLNTIKHIWVDERFQGVLPVVRETLIYKLGIKAESVAGLAGDKTPILKLSYKKGIKPEGYELTVTEDGAYIAASDASGILYAVQTLRIASKADTKKPVSVVECAEISDYPDNVWRGLLLDTARHFWSVKDVKKIIDLLLLHKMNVLHIHLTDDQGWRLEIKKYPNLTKIGSKREKTHIHGWKKYDDDGTPHSGFYTHSDIRELVAYAGARGISIVPEIDMPAHFAAAFASYGHLACRDKKVEVPWYFGGRYPLSQGIKDWNRSACVGKKTTFDFIYAVIDEACELFPSPYFHIGGDEAPKAEWETCPDCQTLMKEEGLANTKELQGYFTNKINEHLRKKGKTVIAWNEVLSGHNVNTDVLVQYWTPQKDANVLEYLKKGGKVLMSKHHSFYFDMSYSQYPLKNTYNFTPFIEGITAEYADQIVGIEGAAWTEWIPSVKKLEFQIFPRLTAAAETGWVNDGRVYKEFKTRLAGFEEILDSLHVNYAEPKIAEPLNPVAKLYNVMTWYAKDQDREFLKNDDLKGKK
ncbi:MAG: beta-N-acetylhexosaminidase [Clostridiales bacterium]|jgi:hexosaminidase|nr:beta-N-acetylhexosaminidase [Clostridiales bacterium]